MRIAVFWIKLIAFLCVLALAVNALGALLDGGDDILQNAIALDHLPKNSVDVLFSGTSHMHYNVIPQYLYDTYGITSTMATGNAVDLSSSYWQLNEALLRQSPKVIVLDVYMAAAPYCYGYVPNVLATKSREKMTAGNNPYNTATGVARWLPVGSPYKLPAIAEALSLSGADGDAYFRITRMHTRYGELSRQNFDFLWGRGRTVKNFGYLYGNYTLNAEDIVTQPYSPEAATVVDAPDTMWIFTDEQLAQVTLMEEVEEQLRRIIRLTESRGIELVLCAAPYLVNDAERKLFAQVGELAASEGVPFVGLDDAGIGVEYLRDMGHLNDAGARLYTDFWGQYFTERYDLSDRRQSTDARYAPWREGEGRWAAQDAAATLIQLDVGLTEYLEALCALNEDYLIAFHIQGDVFDGFTDTDYWLMIDELGIPEEVLESWYYTGSGSQNVVLCGGKLLQSSYEPNGYNNELRWSLPGPNVVLTISEQNQRWSIDDNNLGRMDMGMNIAVYSLVDDMLMDSRTFDLTQMYFDE